MNTESGERPFRWWLLFLQTLALAALIFLIFSMRQRTEPVALELRYRIPGQEDVVETFYTGEPVVVHAPVEIEGYTFLGWEDENGAIETRSSFSIYQDTVYTARYAMTFETKKHIPYLKLDENQVLDVDAPVTIREYVCVLYTILNTDQVGHGVFEDVSKEDACYTAAATLKDLGVYTDIKLYPDDVLTRAELIRSLCCFYPAVSIDIPFSDLKKGDDFYSSFQSAAAYGWINSGPDISASPADPVSHGELARIINRVLGRSSLHTPSSSAVGMIMDVPPSGEYYLDVAEAVIPHEYILQNGEEIWTSSQALPVHEPGIFFVGARLHYILPDGKAAANTTVDDMQFNRNGEFTSGDAELDRMIWKLLPSIIDPDSMSKEDMLSAVYQYVVKNYTYAPGFVYPSGSVDWTVSEAKRMLESGHGNSYSYAALFYQLARFTGYTELRPVSGVIYGTQESFESDDGTRVEAAEGYKPHGWVEVQYKGSECLCDAELESRSNGLVPMYRLTGTVRQQYGYLES